MEILHSIAFLAISFVAIFCSMEILWRLSRHLEKQAAELNRQERMQEPQKKCHYQQKFKEGC
jgi:hypothetical protein